MIVQTFCNGVTQPAWYTIDAVVGATLMNKMEDEGYNLIEDIVLNNYQWYNERGQPKQVGGKFEIDELNLLTTKIDIITQRLRSIKCE